MRAHLVQLEIVWEDPRSNFARVRELVDSVCVNAGDLVVLPEMFDTGFSLNIKETQDDAGETLEFLRTFAQERGVFLHGSRTLIGDDGRGRNMATIIGSGGDVLGEYAKIHPFSYGRESEKFTGGDEIITVGIGSGLTVCPAVCYDLRFPELFRLGLLRGAHMFVVGANWPAARCEHWRQLLIARAIENQAIVLGVNRVGSDPHLAYAGGSIAVDPKGEILAEGDDRERVLTVDIDLNAVTRWRDEFPAWRDVRLMPPG